jgi:hypothetical protein
MSMCTTAGRIRRTCLFDPVGSVVGEPQDTIVRVVDDLPCTLFGGDALVPDVLIDHPVETLPPFRTCGRDIGKWRRLGCCEVAGINRLDDGVLADHARHERVDGRMFPHNTHARARLDDERERLVEPPVARGMRRASVVQVRVDFARRNVGGEAWCRRCVITQRKMWVRPVVETQSEDGVLDGSKDGFVLRRYTSEVIQVLCELSQDHRSGFCRG